MKIHQFDSKQFLFLWQHFHIVLASSRKETGLCLRIHRLKGDPSQISAPCLRSLCQVACQKTNTKTLLHFCLFSMNSTSTGRKKHASKFSQNNKSSIAAQNQWNCLFLTYISFIICSSFSMAQHSGQHHVCTASAFIFLDCEHTGDSWNERTHDAQNSVDSERWHVQQEASETFYHLRQKPRKKTEENDALNDNPGAQHNHYFSNTSTKIIENYWNFWWTNNFFPPTKSPVFCSTRIH